MSLEIDGAAILKALARNPRAFAMSKAEVDTVATAAVASKLREKGLTLAQLRAIAKIVGRGDFSTIVGGLPAKDAKALAKLDACHPNYVKADEHWHRAHVLELARGEAEPVPARTDGARATPVPLSKGPDAPKLPKIGKIMASAAQATAWRGRKPGARPRAKGAR